MPLPQSRLSDCRFVREYSPDAARTDAICFASKQEKGVDPDFPRQNPALAGAEHHQGGGPGVGGRTGRGEPRRGMEHSNADRLKNVLLPWEVSWAGPPSTADGPGLKRSGLWAPHGRLPAPGILHCLRSWSTKTRTCIGEDSTLSLANNSLK